MQVPLTLRLLLAQDPQNSIAAQCPIVGFRATIVPKQSASLTERHPLPLKS